LKLDLFKPCVYKPLTFLGYLLFCIISILNANPREYLGDVNQDGEINVLDIIRVINVILENEPPPSDYELWAGDVNSDINMDVMDIVILVNYIIGEPLECPDTYFICEDDLSQCCQQISSHSFSSVIDTIGSYGSYLLDVSVVSATEFWAVGNIETDTSLHIKNLVHYNNSEWSFLEVRTEFGQTIPLNAIEIFNDQIWVAATNVYQFNGTEWHQFHDYNSNWDFDGYVHDIWIENTNSVYFSGDNGSISHFNGETFEFISTNSAMVQVNIKGNPWVNNSIITVGTITVGWLGNSVFRRMSDYWAFLYFSSHINPTNNFGFISAVDVHGTVAYLASRAGVIQFQYLDSIFLDEDVITLLESPYFLPVNTIDISVNHPQDIMAFTSDGTIHYNGLDWDLDDTIFDEIDCGIVTLKGGELVDNFYVTVGYYCGFHGAIVIRGYRE